MVAALKPDGILLFSVPANPWLFGPHDKAVGHKRRYRRKDIKVLFNHHLQIKMLNYWNTWLFPAIILLRIVKRLMPTRKIADSEAKPLPNWLNYLLYQILAAETRLINRGWRFPWGLSIYGYAIRK
jgi:hypothetical protein